MLSYRIEYSAPAYSEPASSCLKYPVTVVELTMTEGGSNEELTIATTQKLIRHLTALLPPFMVTNYEQNQR